jgi:hypothetical protein
MDSKLTIKLDKNVIERAKQYAALHKRSLSRLIESYLQSLTIIEKSNDNQDFEISPFVKSMSSGISIPTDLNYKDEYSNFLSEKYK